MTRIRTSKFSLGALVAAALGAMFAGPSGRAAQFGRVDLGDEKVNKALGDAFDKTEKALADFETKANGELVTLGKVSKETAEAIEKIGKSQHEMATRLAQMEQGAGLGGRQADGDARYRSWGEQVTADSRFKTWSEGGATKVKFLVDTADELKKVKNTVLGSDTTVAPDRQTGIVAGPARNLLLENYLDSAPTSSNAVEYTRENVFTNNAAETAEGAQKPESSITFTLVNQPVATVAHWIKISRQLSMDAPALAAYINNRMRYGVNKRVEDQIVNGDGTGANIAGLLKAGNYVAHGYSQASLNTRIGSTGTRLDLMGVVIGDLSSSDYPADIIICNPADWWTVTLMKNSQGNYLLGQPNARTAPGIWGLDVIPTNACPQDVFIVMSRRAATVYNREGTVVEMSESDSDNFTKNLITIRAERRVMLAVEIPAAIRAGDLTPA